MIHMLSLEKFENNIKSLVQALKGNRKLLVSCGESESSIIANLLRVLKKPPSSEFNSYIRRFQDKSKNSKFATSTLDFLTQATNRLNISFPKKVTIIILNRDFIPDRKSVV